MFLHFQYQYSNFCFNSSFKFNANFDNDEKDFGSYFFFFSFKDGSHLSKRFKTVNAEVSKYQFGDCVCHIEPY